MDGFVEVIRDIFMSDPENVVGVPETEGAEGAEDSDGTVEADDAV